MIIKLVDTILILLAVTILYLLVLFGVWAVISLLFVKAFYIAIVVALSFVIWARQAGLIGPKAKR
jgi:hypothetical protein